MIRLLGRKPRRAVRQETQVAVDIAGDRVPVTVRHSNRARRYGLKIESATGRVVLTVPQYGNYDEAVRFLADHETWLARRLNTIDGPVPFTDGAVFPLRGEDCRIEAISRLRGVVEHIASVEAAVVRVPGGPDHLSRRLTEWLKSEARTDLEASVERHAKVAGRRPSRVTVRDTTSRWGSCSSRGGLSFSWRLVLAPPLVLDYVAAHEVAHLVHMNHGPEFWALTRRLFPETRRAEAWLKRHGRGLHRYGRIATS